MLKIDLGIMNDGMLRLSIKGEANQTRYGITDLLLKRFGGIRMKLFEFEEEKRRLTFELGTEGNSLCDAKGRVIFGNELRTTVEPNAHGMRLITSNVSMATYEVVERSPGRWSVTLPEEWVVKSTDNLLDFVGGEPEQEPLPARGFPPVEDAIPATGVNVRTPTTKVLSGKVRLPDELMNRLVAEVGLGAQLRMQMIERGTDVILSPRVYKGEDPHTSFTTGNNVRPKIGELLADGDYPYSLAFHHATAWALTISRVA